MLSRLSQACRDIASGEAMAGAVCDLSGSESGSGGGMSVGCGWACSQKTKDEVQQFLDANNLGRPQSPAEWRQCYRELGKFLAMRAFLTNTPQVVMEIPVAPITDDREHMIMRAICVSGIHW